MDIYHVVAELEFPSRDVRAWLDEAPPAKKNAPLRSLASAMEVAEGDVDTTITDRRFGLRASFIDAAYFQVAKDFQAAFARAAARGATGAWWAGGYFAGTRGELEGGVARVEAAKKHPGPPIAAWLDEALATFQTSLNAGSAAPAPAPKTRFLAKKTAPLPTKRGKATKRR